MEGSLGAAYRPAACDWIRLLFRASWGEDHRPEEARSPGGRSDLQRWLMGSVAVLFLPSPYFQPTVVVAPWYHQWRHPDPSQEGFLSGNELVSMLRIGSELYAGLGVAAEARLSGRERTFDRVGELEDEGWRMGYAAEVFYLLQSNELGALRLSLGYSFSDIPDPLLSDIHTGQEGVFVRFQGML